MYKPKRIPSFAKLTQLVENNELMLVLFTFHSIKTLQEIIDLGMYSSPRELLIDYREDQRMPSQSKLHKLEKSGELTFHRIEWYPMDVLQKMIDDGKYATPTAFAKAYKDDDQVPGEGKLYKWEKSGELTFHRSDLYSIEELQKMIDDGGYTDIQKFFDDYR